MECSNARRADIYRSKGQKWSYNGKPGYSIWLGDWTYDESHQNKQPPICKWKGIFCTEGWLLWRQEDTAFLGGRGRGHCFLGGRKTRWGVMWRWPENTTLGAVWCEREAEDTTEDTTHLPFSAQLYRTPMRTTLYSILGVPGFRLCRNVVVPSFLLVILRISTTGLSLCVSEKTCYTT